MTARGADRRGGRGQAMLEFALAAPIFFFLMFGLIEVGRAVYYTQMLDSAARDGARYGVVHGYQSFCPSGPLPLVDGVRPTNLCDADGTKHLIPAVEARAIGVTDKATDLTVHVKWCDATAYQADPPVSQCYDQLPCSAWTTGADLSPDTGGLGDGDNHRGQIVTVCVEYSYKTLLAGYLPLPDFTVSGRASLVVNN